MSKSGKWVEIGREMRPGGKVRTRYRAVICDGVTRTRKWFKTREEARRWLGLSDDAKITRKETRKDIRTDWRFVYGDSVEALYGRESVWS